ncbi:hypothetical protein IDJ75_03220 [Mucilaginibacter rigui]|uniref:WYL domain-containing protein n=1 Tax=Mucilaginibacter rigui TaxID=534635 RepID=A0ABR7X101_9SPHI|nr:hypothetical protein [Mucilaginibacter rigui]MBD1384276.1 hypothetical protein [Mucilaginibacter rigui]
MINIIESTNLITEKLSFLNNCGYIKTTRVDELEKDKNYYLIEYTSEPNNKKIEIALADSNEYISVVIRRKIKDWAGYNDAKNCISITDLALLSEITNYNEDDFSHNLVGRESVIENTCKLLHLNKNTFCSIEWFNITALKQIKIDYYKQKFNIDISSYTQDNNPSFRLKKATVFLLKEGYKLIEDSEDSPPYKNLVWFITYQNESNTIKIKQVDWRDSNYVYKLIINGEAIMDFDITKYQSTEDMSNHIKYLIKEVI